MYYEYHCILAAALTKHSWQFESNNPIVSIC